MARVNSFGVDFPDQAAADAYLAQLKTWANGPATTDPPLPSRDPTDPLNPVDRTTIVCSSYFEILLNAAIEIAARKKLV
jgi:hypothetical protein